MSEEENKQGSGMGVMVVDIRGALGPCGAGDTQWGREAHPCGDLGGDIIGYIWRSHVMFKELGFELTGYTESVGVGG